jgi:hypothetical protein
LRLEEPAARILFQAPLTSQLPPFGDTSIGHKRSWGRTRLNENWQKTKTEQIVATGKIDHPRADFTWMQ